MKLRSRRLAVEVGLLLAMVAAQVFTLAYAMPRLAVDTPTATDALTTQPVARAVLAASASPSCTLHTTPVPFTVTYDNNPLLTKVKTNHLITVNARGLSKDVWIVQEWVLQDGSLADNGQSGSIGGVASEAYVGPSGTLTAFPLGYETYRPFWDTIYILDGPPDVGTFLATCSLAFG